MIRRFINSSTEPRRFLATTALSEFWDKSQAILFLGEWCTTHDNKAVWENLDSKILDSPLIDQVPGAVCKYVDEIYNGLLPLMSDWLNFAHGTKHPFKYWEIVIGSFLFIHIQTIYDRYSRLKKAYTLFPELKTIGLSNSSFITPLDSGEYYTFSIQNDAWNLQIFTQLITLVFNSQIKYKDYKWSSELKQRQKMIKENSYKLRTKVKIYLLWFLVKLRGSKTIALLQNDFDKKDLFCLMRLSGFRILPLGPKKISYKLSSSLLKTVPNILLRKKIAVLDVKDFFSKLVLELLVHNMPMSFLENYKLECKISDKKYPYFSKIIIGNPVANGETLKIWGAKNLCKGAKRVGLQHGGGYGALQSISDEYLEHKSADFYIAWGLKNSGKIIAAPSVPICKQLEINANNLKLTKDNTQIIWVTTEFTRYPIPEIKLALGMGSYEEIYYNWQEKILQLLNPDVFSMLTMRLRHTDFTDHWKFLQDQFPMLNSYKPKNKLCFCEHIRQAKLLLFDNLYTTHLYGLAFNIPSILFWDEKIWTIREEVQFYFDTLQNVGILHKTPESAAKMINEVAHDPFVWWQSQEVQFARQQYCDYFAKISEDWLKEWSNILLNLLKRS